MSRLLTPHIPPSCSLSFRHERHEAADCRIVAGFTPGWFRARIPVAFDERWHRDPRYRHTTMRQMGRLLNDTFPALRLGDDAEGSEGTISQVCTAAFMGALFGLEVIFTHDQWPVTRDCPLSDKDVARLEPPDVRNTPAFADLMRQMELIEAEWGAIDGELNYQGVLNTAFRLRGQTLFMDMISEPACAHHLLDVVCDTMLQVIDAVHARQRAAGVRKDAFVTGNCVVNMISSAHYREFVQPYDCRLSAHFPHFGIHNCAWRVDPYAPAYAEIRTLDYLDFGLDSNLALLRRLFPDTTLSPMYSPVALAENSPAQLRADLTRLRDTLGSCRIIVADIDATTPDARVMEFYRLAAEVWDVPLEALVGGSA